MAEPWLRPCRRWASFGQQSAQSILRVCATLVLLARVRLLTADVCACPPSPATEDEAAAAERRALEERERDRQEKEEFEQRLKERDEVSWREG